MMHSRCCFTPILAESLGVVTPLASRDKDGGHTIRSAVSENPTLYTYANFTIPSFINPELLPIEVLHCVNREFRVFLRKIVDIINFLFALQ